MNKESIVKDFINLLERYYELENELKEIKSLLEPVLTKYPLLFNQNISTEDLKPEIKTDEIQLDKTDEIQLDKNERKKIYQKQYRLDNKDRIALQRKKIREKRKYPLNEISDDEWKAKLKKEEEIIRTRFNELLNNGRLHQIIKENEEKDKLAHFNGHNYQTMEELLEGAEKANLKLTCGKCNEKKSYTEFRVNKANANYLNKKIKFTERGFSSRCKTCLNDLNKEYQKGVYN